MKIIPISPRRLYEGCVLAAVSHAVAVGMYPELNYEHSWDHMTYCVHDSEGGRGAITFHPDGVVGVFQCADSDSPADALRLFDGAPEAILQVAQSEALQYVLCDADGTAKPVISAAFFGTWERLYATQTMDELMEKGGCMIRTHLLPFEDALDTWRDYYDLDDKQTHLIRRLFRRKMDENGQRITVSPADLQALYGDTEECLTSLKELNIEISE
jgi:hypothetical protein